MSVHQRFDGKLLLFTIGIVSAVCGGRADARQDGIEPQRPNILWICCEDLNPVFGCYGDQINAGHTPRLDALAAQGVRFDRCYVTAPVCSSCRSGLITGAYQTTLGIHNHRSSRGADKIHLPDGVTTLPQLLREAGYFTFNVGKTDYNFVYENSDLYSSAKGPSPWQGRKTDQPFFGQIQLRGGKHFGGLARGSTKLADKTDRGKVQVPPYFPDIPIIREQFAVHEDTGRVTDGEVGRILDQLAEDGLIDNTVVFFFSDHGMPTSVRHKQFCYEGGVRVPLVVAGPGIPQNEVQHDLVNSLDISATTVALAGLRQPKWFEGQNVFGANYEPRAYVISARDRCDYTIERIRTVRTDRFRYIRNFMTDRPWMQPQYRDGRDFVEAVRELYRQGKLNPVQARFYGPERPAEELYDLEQDPHQIHDLSADPAYAEVLAEHRQILDQWIKATDDKGQYPESDEGLLAVMSRWKAKCVNPEYDRVRARFEQTTPQLPKRKQ